MTSWRLLRELIFWHAAENPVFLRETMRAPLWYGYYQHGLRLIFALAVLSAAACYAATSLLLRFENVLLLLAPWIALWPIIVGLALAPVVVQERAQQTWDALRATPLSLETILLGKAAAALWWIRAPLHGMIGLLIVVAVGLGLVSLVVTPLGSDPHVVPAFFLCGAPLLIPLLTAALFVLDRAQHFALTAAAVLGAGASSRTVRGALAAGSGVALAVWFADVAAALGLIVLAPGPVELHGAGDLLAVLLLGPVAAFLAEFTLAETVALVAVVLALREIGVRLLWRWALRAAGQE